MIRKLRSSFESRPQFRREDMSLTNKSVFYPFLDFVYIGPSLIHVEGIEVLTGKISNIFVKYFARIWKSIYIVHTKNISNILFEKFLLITILIHFPILKFIFFWHIMANEFVHFAVVAMTEEFLKFSVMFENERTILFSRTIQSFSSLRIRKENESMNQI